MKLVLSSVVEMLQSDSEDDEEEEEEDELLFSYGSETSSLHSGPTTPSFSRFDRSKRLTNKRGDAYRKRTGKNVPLFSPLLLFTAPA